MRWRRCWTTLTVCDHCKRPRRSSIGSVWRYLDRTRFLCYPPSWAAISFTYTFWSILDVRKLLTTWLGHSSPFRRVVTLELLKYYIWSWSDVLRVISSHSRDFTDIYQTYFIFFFMFYCRPIFPTSSYVRQYSSALLLALLQSSHLV